MGAKGLACSRSLELGCLRGAGVTYEAWRVSKPMLPGRGGDVREVQVGELAMWAWWACWQVARLRRAGVVGRPGSLLARACEGVGA